MSPLALSLAAPGGWLLAGALLAAAGLGLARARVRQRLRRAAGRYAGITPHHLTIF